MSKRNPKYDLLTTPSLRIGCRLQKTPLKMQKKLKFDIKLRQRNKSLFNISSVSKRLADR